MPGRFSQHRTSIARLLLAVCCGMFAQSIWCPSIHAAEVAVPQQTQKLVQRYCQDCHQGTDAAAGLDLAQMNQAALARHFQHWKKVITRVADRQMPPEDAEQPTPQQRSQLVDSLRHELARVAQLHAADPGPVTIRRLTGAEYAYTITDLMGLDLDLDRDFVSDAVGGAGFTNVGDVQFMQDSTLERYLAAAKRVAQHAVIGAGPLSFYQAPAEAGFELSAINRIQHIYRNHGFRTAAGEGGIEYGLDRYAQAFYVLWKFRHRGALGDGQISLAKLAQQEGVSPRFAEYLWSVLTTARGFPTSEIVTAWQSLPAPQGDPAKACQQALAQCRQVQVLLRQWQDRFGQNPDAKEEARVLAADAFNVARTCDLEMNINWPDDTTLDMAHLTFAVEIAGQDQRLRPTVIWRNAVIQFRIPDKLLADPAPLRNFLPQKEAKRMGLGQHPNGGTVNGGDFVTIGTQPLTIKLPIVPGARSARILVTAELDIEQGQDGIVRCVISQREETDQGKSVSALLANPRHPDFVRWKSGVLEFARLLPQISHREPAPSDRDPIPAPFDSSYNNAERNAFHSHVKYHRDDRFLVENMLDAETRKELELAWTDLLGSFDYHQASLNLLADKYHFEVPDVAELSGAEIDALPKEAQPYVRRLQADYLRVQSAFASAQSGHLDGLLTLANQAWRRPLQPAEEADLVWFYQELIENHGLEHRPAVRAVIARILMSPSFLYRAELPNPADKASAVALNDWEIANRLSYFLWSSLPDEELRAAAAAGELRTADQVAAQAQRMLHDPKARRLAVEFFGQWLGFYQFDRYRGVDRARFPEFTDSLQAAMYEESVSFFEHIVRQDRPVREILFADYIFANSQLAQHYGLQSESSAGMNPAQTVRLDGVPHRGGLFGLATVLTVTSAPLRTSPVKRGDWILRRVLGTPVPPPPADAGSIAADDVSVDKLTIRQRLEAHRREVSCRNCHARIDPLGFTLEQYDAIGRWRDTYRDGQPIDVSGTLFGGEEVSGPAGLRAYLAQHEDLFREALCTKLVGYALGRGESIADAALVTNMTAELTAGDGKFSTLIDCIVRSKQFRFRRSGQEGNLEGETNDE